MCWSAQPPQIPKCGQIGAIRSGLAASTSIRAAWPLPGSTELPAADIDGLDLGRAAGEQHVGEASGRGADIERNPPRRLQPEGLQGGRELEPAAGDVGRGARLDLKDRAGTPATLTAPRRTRSAAWAREGARPVSTNNRSRRAFFVDGHNSIS